MHPIQISGTRSGGQVFAANVWFSGLLVGFWVSNNARSTGFFFEKTLGCNRTSKTETELVVYHAVTPAASHLLFVVRDANFQSITLLIDTQTCQDECFHFLNACIN